MNHDENYTLADVIHFRAFISLTLIKVGFALGTMGLILACFVSLVKTQYGALSIPATLIAIVLLRIFCEFLAVVFSIQESLNDLRRVAPETQAEKAKPSSGTTPGIKVFGV